MVKMKQRWLLVAGNRKQTLCVSITTSQKREDLRGQSRHHNTKHVTAVMFTEIFATELCVALIGLHGVKSGNTGQKS